MTERTQHHMLLLALALFAIGFFGVCRSTAQDNPETLLALAAVDPRVTAREDPGLLLGQAVIAEAGWTARNDHTAILYVLRRRATLPAFRRNDGLRPEVRVALAYVRAFNPRGPLSDRQKRMRNLGRPLLEERSPSVARLVAQWIDGRPPPDPCRQPAWHWGSRIDTRGTALPRVDCGFTTNIYLGAPVRAVALPIAAGGILPASVASGRMR